MFGAKKEAQLPHAVEQPGEAPAARSRDRWAGPSPSIAERPSRSRSEKWMWQELPSRAFGLAMNVIDMPSWAAISFAPFL